jgi:hypothetical protein
MMPEIWKMGDPEWLRYFDQAQLHLRTGYPKIWELWTKVLDETSAHLTKVKDMLSSLESVLTKEILDNFPQAPQLTSLTMIGKIVWAAFDAIQGDVANPHGFEPITVNLMQYVDINNPVLLLKVDGVVEKVINSGEICGQGRDVFNDRARLLGRIAVFKARLDEMVDEFEQVHINLLGTCYRCEQIRKV